MPPTFPPGSLGADESGHYSTAGGNDPFETPAPEEEGQDCDWDNCFKPATEEINGRGFCANHAEAMKEIARLARKQKETPAAEYDPTKDHEACAACGFPISAHNPPGALGDCPLENKTLDAGSASGVSSGNPEALPPGFAPRPSAISPGDPTTGVREVMEQAAAASWQPGALEAMEGLRLRLPSDAPQPILDHFKLLAESIAGDVAGVSPDVLSVPENVPPYLIDGKSSKPNLRGARPQWKAEALKALTEVMDKIDVDASNAVYDNWGNLKDAINKAEAFPETGIE